MYGSSVSLPEISIVENALNFVTQRRNLNIGSVKQARTLWSSLAGDVFSNFNTIFVSEKFLKQLKEKEYYHLVDQSMQRDYLVTLEMISRNYDLKLLILSALVPTAIWSATYLANRYAEKIEDQEINNSSKIKKLISLIKRYENSFIAKATTSACIIGAYILVQRYSIGKKVNAYMKIAARQ